MGKCVSKPASKDNSVINQSKKSERQLKVGVKFKDIEFGGFIGISTNINDVYTPVQEQPSVSN